MNRCQQHVNLCGNASVYIPVEPKHVITRTFGCTNGKTHVDSFSDVGPDTVEFESLHPYGGAEGGALQDLSDVLGSDHFGGGVLAEHGKGVGWAGLSGCGVSACGCLDRAKVAFNGFMGQRCIADHVLLVAESQGHTCCGEERFERRIG